MSGSGAPFFSVIMPVYNHAAYVGAAIESVMTQSFGDWELIVVDDGSTDGGPKIIEGLAHDDPRIRFIRQENAGPAAARNHALKHARAHWLAYLDSDDLWYEDALARYRAAISQSPDAEFFYGYRDRLDSDGRITKLPGEFQESPTGTAELFGRMYLSHLSVCYRRALIEKVGGYDAKLRSCEDYELYLRISLHTRFVPIAHATGLRRRHGTNLSRQTGFSRRVEAEVLRRFADRDGGAAVLDPERIARRLFKLYYASGRQYVKERRFRDAHAMFARAHAFGRSFKSTALQAVALLCSVSPNREPRRMPEI